MTRWHFESLDHPQHERQQHNMPGRDPAARRLHESLDTRIGAAALGVSVCSLLFAVVGTLWLALFAMVLAGFAYVTAVASTNMLIQLTVDDALRGRVMPIFSIVFVGFMPLGSLLGGAAADVIGAPATVILFAFLCLIGAIMYLGHVRPGQSPCMGLATPGYNSPCHSCARSKRVQALGRGGPSGRSQTRFDETCHDRGPCFVAR